MMFKWACLGTAVLALLALLWMVNDIRRQVRESAAIVQESGSTVNENLPAIVTRTRQTAEALPDVAKRVQAAADVLGELAEDIRQLKELAGADRPRDRNVIAYADSALSAIEKSGGWIGVKKNIGRGIKNDRPATEWTPGARKEAAFMALLVSTKKDMALKIAHTKLGFDWWIEVPGQKPLKLLEWLKANHKETRELSW